MKVTTKKIGEGKYEVRVNGVRLQALIIGANRKYMLEYWGLPGDCGPFGTITLAASYAASLSLWKGSANGSK